MKERTTTQRLLEMLDHTAATMHDNAGQVHAVQLCCQVMARAAVEQASFIKGHIYPELVKQTLALEAAAVAQAVRAHASCALLCAEQSEGRDHHEKEAWKLVELIRIGKEPEYKHGDDRGQS